MDDNRKFWDSLYSANYAEYKKAYLDFMYNMDNCMKCKKCPENRSYSVDCGTGSVGPCGQQNCWVKVHCK